MKQFKTHPIPKKELGQNFLIDQQFISLMCETACLIDNQKTLAASHIDTIHFLEIGPGIGTLTLPLLEQAKVKNLTVVELDQRCIPHLQKLADNYKTSNIKIIHQDILDFDYLSLENPFSIIGSLPYYISTKLVLEWLAISHLWSQAVIMVQKEVGERLTSQKGSSLSILTSWLCHAQLICDVPPEAFSPEPKVESQIIKITPKSTQEIEKGLLGKMKSLTKKCFAHKRKMLKHSFPETQILQEANIDPNTRAETLTSNDFLNIIKLSS